MSKLYLNFLLWVLQKHAVESISNTSIIWPLPVSVECLQGPPVVLSSELNFNLANSSSIASAAVDRYKQLLRPPQSMRGKGTRTDLLLASITITWKIMSETLDKNTDYSYTLRCCTVEPNGDLNAQIVAASVFGVGPALETLVQLADNDGHGRNSIPCGGGFSVLDHPTYRHRGLMVDSGRRYYPISLLQSTLDAMSAFKMNVLHFHLSEVGNNSNSHMPQSFCNIFPNRLIICMQVDCFRVESFVFPALHRTPCVINNRNDSQYYTQAQIRELVQYARERGIRIIPEFDMPGHAGGMCNALASQGLVCCQAAPMSNYTAQTGHYAVGRNKGGPQIYDDPAGKSVAIASAVLTEMAGLFPDAVLNVGSDETIFSPPSYKPNCDFNNTFAFETKILRHVVSLGKTPMGWGDILFQTGAAKAFPSTILDAWRHHWTDAARVGHHVVTSSVGPFYLDRMGNTAHGMWVDIGRGSTNASLNAFLLGGEVAMWSDDFMNSCMFWSPQNDSLFSNATARCIWPRTAIAAGSFWRHNATLQDISPVLATVQRRLSRRGLMSCQCTNATHNGCDQSTRCDGSRYCPHQPGPHPHPPHPPSPAPPTGRALRCKNFTSVTGYRCINMAAGASGIMLKTETLSCDTPGACAEVAAARCSSEVPHCARFSFAYVLPSLPTIAHAQVQVNVSFFPKSSPRPAVPATNASFAWPCDPVGDVHQRVQFVHAHDANSTRPTGTLRTPTGLCLDVTIARAPLSFLPCHDDTLSPNQTWTRWDDGTFRTRVQQASGTVERCLDSYAHPDRAGGKAGVWGCTNRDQKQNWTISGQTLADTYGHLCLSYDKFPAETGLVADPASNVWIAISNT